MMKLEDLADVFVGDVTLYDRDKQLALVLDCGALRCCGWLGIVPVPEVSLLFCDMDDGLCALLDCNDSTLRRFRREISFRCKTYTGSRWDMANDCFRDSDVEEEDYVKEV